MKKIMDLTRKKTVCEVTDFTSWVFLNCDTAVSIRFLERLGLEAVSRRFLERLVSVLNVERLGLVSVLKVDRLGLVT